MFSAQINEILSLAEKGDPYARSLLLAGHKNFVKEVASQVCNRVLHWQADEELNVAQNAFDEAIDSFSKSKEENFFKYAEKIICLRLCQRLTEAGKLDEHTSRLNFQHDLSFSSNLNAKDRRTKISMLCEKHNEVLEQYGVSPEDLLGSQQRDCGIVVQLKVKIYSTRELLKKYWELLKQEMVH